MDARDLRVVVVELREVDGVRLAGVVGVLLEERQRGVVELHEKGVKGVSEADAREGARVERRERRDAPGTAGCTHCRPSA